MDKQQTYSLHIIDGNELEVTHQTKKRKHEENNNTDGYKQEVKSRKYFCSACENFFKYKSQYEKHKCLPINIPESDEPLQEINKEMKISLHQNKLDHHCTKCEHKFQFKHDHIRGNICNEKISEMIISNDRKKMVPHQNKLKHHCTKCEHKFQFKYQLKNHICGNIRNEIGSEMIISKNSSTTRKTNIGSHENEKLGSKINSERMLESGEKEFEIEETAIRTEKPKKIQKCVCSICQQTFKSYYQYKKHKFNCINTDNIGGLDGNVLKEPSGITIEETKIGKHLCSKCQQNFKFKYEFKKHQNICKSTEQLSMNGPKKTTVTINEKVKIVNQYCSKCQQNFKFKYQFKKHQKSCNITDNTEEPKKTTVIINDKAKNGKHFCSKCQQNFKFKYEFKKHQNNCKTTDNTEDHNEKETKKTKLTNDQTTKLLTNEQTKIGKHVCSKCQQSFKFKYEFKKHNMNCKTIDDTQHNMNKLKESTILTNKQTKIGKHFCSKCQQSFKFKYLLKKHQINCKTIDDTEQHNIMKEPTKRTVLTNKPTNVRKHFCSKCQQSFKFKYEFKKHQKNCETTDGTTQHNIYLSSDSLKIKQNKKKKKSKKLSCLECDKSFTFCYQYKQHVYMFHSGAFEKIIESYIWNDENSGIGNQIVEDYDSVLANQHAADTEHKEYKICFRCIKIFQNGKHICIPMNFSDKDIYNFKNQQNVLRKGTANNFHNFFCKDCHKYFQYWYQFKIHSCQRVFVEEEELEEEETEVYEMDKNSKEYKRFKNKRWKPNILEVYDHSSGAMKTVYHCKICDLFFEAYKNFNFHSDFHFLC